MKKVKAVLSLAVCLALAGMAHGNEAPMVNAGPNQTVPLAAPASGIANLDGTVTDDGLPSPPGTVTYTWTLVDGVYPPVFGDSTWYDAWPRHTDQPAVTMDAFGIMDQGTSNEMQHFCIDRHDGFVNLLFMDWSARDVGLKELWTLKWHRAYVTNGPWTRAGGARPEDWPVWMRSYKDY